MPKSLENHIKLLRLNEASFREETLTELTVNFPTLIKSAKDIEDLFLWLSPGERTQFYNQFKQEIFAHVSTLRDFSAVGFRLSQSEAKELYEHLERIGALVASTVRDYCNLLSVIKEPELRTVIVNGLEKNVPTLIQSANDIEALFLWLSSGERTRFYNQFKQEIFAHVSTLKDFSAVGFRLSQSEAKELYEHLEQIGALVASTVRDYCNLLSVIKEPGLRTVIVNGLEKNVPALIQSANDIEDLFLWLSPGEITRFYNQFKQEIFAHVSTLDDLLKIGFRLSQEQVKEVYHHLGILTSLSSEYNQQDVIDSHKRIHSTLELKFNERVELLQQKMTYFLGKPEFIDAYAAAAHLYAALNKAGTLYFSNPQTQGSYEHFQSTCKTEIKTAREILDQHRGWTKILLNILAIVVTGGVGYAIAAGIDYVVNGKFTFFSTDSSLKIDEIEESIHQAAPAA
ncbi:hypothetical protein [Legionella fallonii]|uniref:Ankyrin repeat protein n=1 Tax=Legionella fallonii LLAP-10 TaxID=1212491 RepID=A0A098G261_9GAMM|nr:hypothetical protein [Legionella fallonii]CEG56563.1 conserved protein of unknown function [Legionella fallonii LLAP-10]